VLALMEDFEAHIHVHGTGIGKFTAQGDGPARPKIKLWPSADDTLVEVMVEEDNSS